MLESGVSSQFAKVSQNKMKLIDIIVQNDNIIKHSINLGEVNIDSIKIDKECRRKFFKENLILNHFTHDLRITDIVYYMVTPRRGFSRVDSTLGNDEYVISIICPARFWFIEHLMVERPMVIAEELAKSIDKQRIAGIGMVHIGAWNAYKLNDDFACLDITISVADVVLKR